MVQEVDVHQSKSKYASRLNKINLLPDSQGKEILLQYVEWHNEKIPNKITYASATRSLDIALRFIDEFQKPFELTQRQLEKWFEKETKRNCLIRTGGDSLKETNRKISLGSIEKFQSQMLKFIKFIEFLKLKKPINLFNSKRMPVPLIAQFCFLDTNKKKQLEPPLVNQEQIKKVIDYLLSTGNYVDSVTGTLVALLNDTGMRLSEALTLRHCDLINEENYWLVQLQQSKTRTRTNVILLSKEYISKWLSTCPTKNNKQGLIFCTKTGEPVAYSPIRKSFINALEKNNVNWKTNSSFHYLRHLTASRLYEMPGNLIKYYLGWEDSEMRAVYSNYSWKVCIPYLLKSIKNNPMNNTKLSYMEEIEPENLEAVIERILLKKNILS